MALPKSLQPKFKTHLERFGRDNDGGYLVTKNSIKKAKTLISFGVLDDCSFETDFAKIKKVNTHCYDHTVGKNFWKKRIFNDIGAALYNLNFAFIKNTLRRYKEFKSFFSQKFNTLHIETIKKNSIKKIIEREKLTDQIFFKIDIEGSEYRILDELIKYENKICALIIEFHDVDLHIEKISNFINKFKLDLTHTHPNNYGGVSENNIPLVLECTFENNPEKIIDKLQLPNNCDQPNNPLNKDINLFFEN
jgi:FkbM family methyltransferase